MHLSLLRVAAVGALVVGLSAEPLRAHEVKVPEAAPGKAPSCDTPGRRELPEKAFSNPPEKPHDPKAHVFSFDQLSHFYRQPGEFTHRLNGDEYGFDSLSFIITETHPGGGPGLHVHDTEEAHVLLEGTARYRIGDETLTVTGPYVAKVPAGTPHTFVNAGAEPFRLVAVFGSKHPGTTRLGPNPLVDAAAKPCAAPPKP